MPSRALIPSDSRASAQKWPQQPDRDLIYPPDGRWDIRVLGWDPVVTKILGAPPPTWSVHRFGSVSPRDFLADLDFFVYFHHPRWVEAFGRTILEALASGAVAVLPRHFEQVFGQAAVYAEPHEVRATVQRLSADPAAYVAQSERGICAIALGDDPDALVDDLRRRFERADLVAYARARVLRRLAAMRSGVRVPQHRKTATQCHNRPRTTWQTRQENCTEVPHGRDPA